MSYYNHVKLFINNLWIHSFMFYLFKNDIWGFYTGNNKYNETKTEIFFKLIRKWYIYSQDRECYLSQTLSFFF